MTATMPPVQTLPEYADNLFIRALPDPQSLREILRLLERPPRFDLNERDYPATLRKHCVLRLGHAYHPMARQVQLADRIGMIIRQGYLGRNPETGDYLKHLQDGAERIEAESLSANTNVSAVSTATSLALVGCSGSGKSTTVERTLALMPQLVRHDTPFTLVQIVWLKLDCPTQGSPKQLCINFFAEVDRLLGTDYLRRYGHQSHSVEFMLVHMAQVARLYAVGLLVVDEIQNLKRAAVGPEALLNFLVLLINTIGIPVFVIGTLGAIPILQRNFRQARRAAGLATAIWDRMPRGTEWDAFVKFLWQFQWTSEATELTSELEDALYDESQGIVDVVVKLFMLAQLRLISIAEVRPKAREEITVPLLRQVAREHLTLIRPMIEALRKNDTEALKKYDDLVPLQTYVDIIVRQALGGSAGIDQHPAPESEASAADTTDDAAGCVVASLVASGVAQDVANALVREVCNTETESDPLALLAAAIDRIRRAPPKKAPRNKSKPSAAEDLPESDLRRITAEGKQSGKSAYESLHGAGLVGLPFDLKAA